MRRGHASILSVVALGLLCIAASPASARQPGPQLRQQARSRLNHLDQAYGKSESTVSQHRFGSQITEYRHTNTLRVEAARPLISIGRVKLLHWGITNEQAVKRLSQGKPVRFGVRSYHLTLGGSETPLFRSTLVGPRVTTTSIPTMLQWTQAAETFMAKRTAKGQLSLPLGK